MSYRKLKTITKNLKEQIEALPISDEKKELWLNYARYSIRVDRWPDGIDPQELMEDLEKYEAITRGGPMFGTAKIDLGADRHLRKDIEKLMGIL